MSRYALSKRTGVAQAALCRFMQGQRGLTTDSLDRLAVSLQLRVEKITEKETPAGASKTRGVGSETEIKTPARARKQMPEKQRKISRF
jgi:hypothetical protein